VLNKNGRPKPVTTADPLARPAHHRIDWRLALGVLLTAGILLFALFNRAWILEALGLARAAKPAWLLLAFVVIMVSFLISSQVFHVVLRSLGRFGLLWRRREQRTVDEIGRQVSQQRTIESILISAEQVSAAAAIIRQVIEAGAEVIEAPAEATVRFRTSCPETELKTILARLIQDGMEVTQFREVQTDLEEAFMSFARPQAAAGARPAVASGAAHV
jgi:ABC-2 type transport system ATP-binding protein